MGKTLSSYFGAFSPSDVCQIFVQSEIPTEDTVCNCYYRMTDFDAFKSIFKKKIQGDIFNKEDIQINIKYSRVDQGIKKKIYAIGRKRKAASYIVRDLIWLFSNFPNEKLRKWINKNEPDIVFFASGGYSFLYRIACQIAEYKKVPLVTMCVDDYYLYDRNSDSYFGRAYYKSFMKTVHKTMKRSELILAISDQMAEEYKMIFNKNVNVLHTSSESELPIHHGSGKKLSYIGNLGYNRHLQLVAIGKALKKISARRDDVPKYVDVYSASDQKEVVQEMLEENGIHFHGRINSNQVLEVMSRSVAVIHTESFDIEMRKLVRFSVSTKVAESLQNAPCIIAYGPNDIASISYLKQHNAAFVISSLESLEKDLEAILTDEVLRTEIMHNARVLAIKNHHNRTNSLLLHEWLQKAAGVI